MPAPTDDWRKYVEQYAREHPECVTGVRGTALEGHHTVAGTSYIMPNPPDPACKESAFQDWTRVVFVRRGWRFYHTRRSKGSDPDFPDCVMARGSTGIAAELKSAKGKVTKGQEEWLELLRRVGFRTFVWRPADWLKIVEVAT